MGDTSGSARRLKELAKDDMHRLEVMKGRITRRKSRDRILTCPMCLDRGYSARDASDVCDNCVIEKWDAQDAAKRTTLAEKGEGFVVVRTSSRYWDYPYPGLGNGKYGVPEGAIFRQPEESRSDGSAERTLQILFNKIVVGLGRAHPVPEPMRKDAVTFMATTYESDIYTLLPNEVFSAIRQLWHFIEWLSLESDRQAFERGTNLLGGMVKGEITADMFDKMTIEQTGRIRERQERANEGSIRR